MATAKKARAANSASTVSAKQGQKSKQPAQPVAAVRPACPKGWVQCPANASAKKQDAQPSEYYPQGNVEIQVLAAGPRMGSNQQANHAALVAALGGSTGTLSAALANGATRRHVRRLARSGYLVWRA